jgi:protein-L-isoaspartate(D-aspartate) O-methyltransferase
MASKRHAMVETQLKRRGISDPEVLRAMGTVPRHAFVPDELEAQAYADWPLPIGGDQTISQPYIVAYMTQALSVRKGDKILEIGAGSGYQAAVLAEMGANVYTIEILPELEKRAAAILEHLGYAVHARVGDGYDGWPEAAPFDGVIVTAAPPTIPDPLIAQLKNNGRLVVPVGTADQTLEVYRKQDGALNLVETLPVRFVPMTGKAAAR